MKQRDLRMGDKVTARDGRPAGIYWVGDGRVHGWVENDSGRRRCSGWPANGIYVIGEADPDDLILVTERREKWAVLCVNAKGELYVDGRSIKREADERAAWLFDNGWPHVSIHRIEYEAES